MIPKVLHYCWFGGGEKSPLIKDCLESWKLHLPEYQIIEWNETNSDLRLPFVKKAYRQQKWAFVADYIRLKVLYEQGGIYLDTDMLLLQPLDSLLCNTTFLGAECKTFINCSIIGTTPHSNFIQKCMSEYGSIKITKKTDWGTITIPRIVTRVFKQMYGLDVPLDTISTTEQITIYPAAYFYPLQYQDKTDAANYKQYLRPESFAVHLWSSSWIDSEALVPAPPKRSFKDLFRIIKTIFVQKNESV
ncbi:glycosyltransferase [Flavobacterium crassostreae]|uniref:Alpha 1,4-glycosyltransferase domain-containing protein n=1 Tax=Flavobacterium crassostreae TaxID=1763534 RepID=A0A1B9E3M9_9FLAO|nr:glycosyltransferase [Flavobacterium crassostreae]OCB76553.1 hypothetical protein LPBF_06365 [Flavobacterium crassostreae]